MTQQKELEKAQKMIGSWIYDKTEKYVHLFVYDYYESTYNDGDVVLKCIALQKGGALFCPSVMDKDVWVSELKEFYRKLPDGKGVKTWEKIKKEYDKMFKGE